MNVLKKYTLLMLALTASLVAGAQEQMRIWHGGKGTRTPLTTIVYNADGTTFTVNGTTYEMAEVDSITMVHVMRVHFDGNRATVQMGDVENVSYTIDGAHVNIENNNTANELEVYLSGTAPDGSLTYTGTYKCKFYLNGVNLTSSRGAAIDIQCGKRVDVTLMDGTVNTLVDCPDGEQKGTFYCKGHVQMNGGGSLIIKGNTRHAFACKEYLSLSKSTGKIQILGAVSDGLHVGQYFDMRGGDITIENVQRDGIELETIRLDDEITPNPSKELNGLMMISGGTITASITGEDAKGIRNEEGDMTITGGTILINNSGNGSRGIQTDGNLTIGGTADITINASGDRCTLPEHKADPHRCRGMKLGGNLTIEGGVTTITSTGNKSQDIKLAGKYTKTGGILNATINY